MAFVHAAATGPPSQTYGQASLAAWYVTRRPGPTTDRPVG